VGARHARHVFVATKGAAGAWDFVGSDGTSDARPADNDAEIALTADDIAGDSGGEIGVITSSLAEGAQVKALVTCFLKALF
jgi:hypothetical protein